MNSAEKSPAGKVMIEAIELEIEGRSPYPKKAAFIDAGTPWTEQEIRRSAMRGNAIVLVSPNGDTRILSPEAALGS